MLTKSQARAFFLIGTAVTTAVFVGLTVDTFRRIPAQTNSANLTEQVARGKALWDRNNCMGCHTILGEGAYYAPELTKVHKRRGPDFIRAMLRDPEAMYPGQRRMVKYDFTPEQIDDLVAFFEWIGKMDPERLPAHARSDAGRAAGRRHGGLGGRPAAGVQPDVRRLPCPRRTGRRSRPGARWRGVAVRRGLHRRAG